MFVNILFRNNGKKRKNIYQNYNAQDLENAVSAVKA